MELVSFELDIQFTETGQIDTPAYRLFKAVSSEPKPKKLEEPGVRITDKKKSTIIGWEYDSCYIKIENQVNSDKCIKLLFQYLDIINSIAPITEIESRNLTTHWMIATPNYDFISLEQLYRGKSIQQYSFVNGVYDSSVIFDIKIGNYSLHHQSGAMESNQLNTDYLEYERKDLPKTFIFLDASILDETILQYNREGMESFTREAFNYCLAHSKEFGELWERYL